MTVYKYFDIEYIGYKNKKLALYLVFVQTQTQKQAKVSLPFSFSRNARKLLW